MRYGETLTWVGDDGQTAVFTAGSSSAYWLDDADGLGGLEANIYTTKGSGQDGESYVSSNIAMRTITIEGRIRYNQDSYKKSLLSIMAPKAAGKLVYTYGSTTRYVRGYIRKAPVFSNTRIERFQTVIVCPNPFWRYGSGDLQIQTIAEITPLWEFPFEIPETGMEFASYTPSLVTNINNPGDVDSGLVVTFYATAACDDPELVNVDTGETLSLTYSMIAGDLITVRTGYGEKRAELLRGGVTTNIFNSVDVDSVWLQLYTGDNLLRYGGSATANLEVTLYYDIQYLGV